MKAPPVGVGVVVAVSLVALAAVLGYQHGRDEVPYESIADIMGDLGRPTAAEFRREHPDDAEAQRVTWIHPTLDAEGEPVFMVAISGEGPVDAAGVCASVAAFLAERRGLDLSGGHTELLFASDGAVLRRWRTPG